MIKKYTIDSMGNLLTEESALKSTKYAYNSQNRLIYCEVTDRSNREYAQTNYAYDAFGRRVLVQDKGEAALRTLYDGLTFDVIKQSPTFENGLFTDSQNTGIQWGKTGKPTGNRYRYIGDEESKGDSRYVYLDEDAYRIKNTRYTGERTQITVNGTVAAQSSSEGTQYYTTDLFGSVSSISDSSGYQIGSYTYDAFGSLIQGDLTGATDFGYLGKQNDPTSRLYNYGYRDYAPQSARFTTVDPIRDGTNWFAYVNNDPVNFVDLWGLQIDDETASLKKQKELEEMFGYDNILCYITTGLNTFISDKVVTENFIETKLGDIIKNNLDKNNKIKDFNIYSKNLGKELEINYYYSFVYDKDDDWNQVKYKTKEEFYNSKYPYGVGRYLKPGNSWDEEKGADHFELLRNDPYNDVVNPGIADDEGDYILYDILPLQKLSL